ncbi:MAG: ABC transporter permease [Candidatus Thermoplasmatota archaeon]|jgi:ABC-2 type transport system permease protein
MHNVVLLASKEYRDALRSRLFLVLLVLFLGLTATSVFVASSVFQGQLQEYQAAAETLRQLGKQPTEPAPQLYPLTMLRGTIEYLEIIGAILGIVLGWFSVAKEKNQKTLQLILTRPVERADIVTGKLLGNASLLLSALFVAGAILGAGAWLFAGVGLTVGEGAKLLAILAASLLYILPFYFLASFLSLRMKSLSQSLMICFAAWLVIVLVIPQIGDTLDPDNQVPGGFFKSLDLNKTQEKQVMGNFSGYERTRNAIEETSVAKHYERLSFAVLGIKKEFNGQPLGPVLVAKARDIAWIASFALLGAWANYAAVQKKDALIGDST